MFYSTGRKIHIVHGNDDFTQGLVEFVKQRAFAYLIAINQVIANDLAVQVVKVGQYSVFLRKLQRLWKAAIYQIIRHGSGIACLESVLANLFIYKRTDIKTYISAGEFLGKFF